MDVGGTFTDIVCVREGRPPIVFKVPSTPGDPGDAAIAALERLGAREGVEPGSIAQLAHGTTVATNAVLERKGGRLGIIATEGFRDTLEIGRQMRRRMYEVRLDPQTPVFLAPRAMRLGVRERIGPRGEVIERLDEDSVHAALERLVAAGAECVAVCLLFSFVNAAHERRVREIAYREHPGLEISLSSEVDPAFREYERTAVTAFDAYIKPTVRRYLTRLGTRLAGAGVTAPLQVMQSRGGLAGAELARDRPVRLFLSGPAAGVIGGQATGTAAGYDDLITLDVGGTSSDIALVSGAKPLLRAEGVIDGFPVRVPMARWVRSGASTGAQEAGLNGAAGARRNWNVACAGPDSPAGGKSEASGTMNPTAPTAAPASGRKPALGFIFITVVLAVLGFGLLIPVLPNLVKEFRGGSTASGSHYYGVLVSVYAFMQFFGAPILGSLSDRFGRRKVILIALAGSSLDFVVMAIAPSLTILFIARMVGGLTAGLLSTANAYVADVTPPEKRAQGFGMIGAAFGLGFVVGPLVGGLLGSIDLRLPFWAAAGCSAANWIYGYFVLPESLAPENRRAFSWKRANPIGALAALKRFPAVLGLAEAYFILTLGQMMLFSIWALYTGHRYHWDPKHVGFSLMLVGVLSAVVQAVLAKRLIGRVGDTRGVVLGLLLSAAAQTLYGLAPEGWMIYFIVVIGSCAGIAGPAMQSYITKHVPPNEQGAVQGIYSGLASLAGIPGPLIATWSFGWAVADGQPAWLAGLPFFIAAGLALLALALATRSFAKDHAPAAGMGTA